MKGSQPAHQVAVPVAIAPTLREALDRYAREVTPAKKGALQELRRIKYWQGHYLGDRPLDSIRGADLAAWPDERLKRGAGAKTIRLDLAVISHLYEVARKEWRTEHLANPVKLIRKPKLPPGRDRRLAPGEEPKLLLACHPTLLPIVKPAIETVMRRSELLGLQWRDVNLGKRISHLRDTKNGTARSVPLSTVAVGVLCSQAFPRAPRSGTLKVCSGVDEVWVTRAFTAAAKRAGCVGLRFHDLRHEATSRLFEKGLNVMEVGAITGHKDLKMMLQRYTLLRAEDLVAKLG